MMSGRVEEIFISAHATESPYAVARARAIAGIGLEGDRYFAGVGTWSDYPVQTGKDLTLIEAEVLEAVGLSGSEARRNVVTRGIRLNELVGRRFRVGEIECYGDRLCEPCTHLEGLTGVSVATLARRGGLRADILSDGSISVGDLVTAEPAEEATIATGHA
jgi:MOSC domain-containing protein YiiM